jgi:hypothetical protein
MKRSACRFGPALILWLFAVAGLAGQTPAPPWEGTFTHALGLPQHWKWHGGLAIGSLFSLSTYHGQTDLNFGFYREILMQDIQALGVLAEGSVGFRAGRYDAAGRMLLASPAFCVAVGVDWSSLEPRPQFLLRIWLPVKRGGLLLRGGQLYIDAIPQRNMTFRLGLSVPLWQRDVGTTRPPKNHVSLENLPIKPVAFDPGRAGMQEALARMRDHGRWINRLAIPFLDAKGPDANAIAAELIDIKARLAQHKGQGPGFGADREAYAFHDALEESFGLAAAVASASDEERREAGRRVAVTARDILFNTVLSEYDRLIGQEKRPDTTTAFAARADDVFARWLVLESGIAPERHAGLIFVFDQLLGVVESARADSARRWGNSRLVWLPLQYAFLPNQTNSQAELDRVIGRLVGAEMTDGNELTYILNDQFHWELMHSIEDATDYHVLWIHDFPGTNEKRQPDKMAFEQIARAYLPAMIKHLQDYDRTGRFPTYMIFLDQHYYEKRHSSAWMRFLSDPLEYRIRLSKAPAMERELAAAQVALRRAVADSRLLGEQIRQNGRRWLRNFISVKVSITNPADSSFRTRLIIPAIGIPDNLMRDHRKIVLYDITEDDPYKGEAIYTGMGVGEQYSTGYWEDRGMIVRGPDNLHLKRVARELLLSQGFTEDDIPYALRPQELPRYYAALVQDHIAQLTARGRRAARLLDVHNATGCGQKDVSAVRGALYSLLPAGTILTVPDSLWFNFVYGGLILGDALRGVNVWMIAPSLAAAPNPGAAEMTRTRTLLSRLLIARQALAEEMTAAGGTLRIGIYNPTVGVGDVPGRFLAMSRTFETVPFLKSVYNFTPEVAGLLTRTAEILKELKFEESFQGSREAKEKAKLHIKASFAISGSAFRKLIGRPEWKGFFHGYLHEQARLVTEQGAYKDPRLVSYAIESQAQELFRQYQSSLSPEEQAHSIVYFLIGTSNMDYRSMIFDGEAMILTSGLPALSPLLDFAELEGLSRWVETQTDIDSLIPPTKGAGKSVARLENLAL